MTHPEKTMSHEQLVAFEMAHTICNRYVKDPNAPQLPHAQWVDEVSDALQEEQGLYWETASDLAEFSATIAGLEPDTALIKGGMN